MPWWTARGDARQLLRENLDDDLELYLVGHEVNTSAKDKQPYDPPTMIEPIHLLWGCGELVRTRWARLCAATLGRGSRLSIPPQITRQP
jgi:hypothetical protein